MPIGDYEIAGFKVNVSYKHKSQLPAAIKSESHEDEYSNDSSIESISKTGNKIRSSIKYFKSLAVLYLNKSKDFINSIKIDNSYIEKSFS